MTHPLIAKALQESQGIITFSKPSKWTIWGSDHVQMFGAPTLPQRIELRWLPHSSTSAASNTARAVTIESFTPRQAFTKVWQGAGMGLDVLWALEYAQVLVQTPAFDLHILRKGDRLTVKERPASRHVWQSLSSGALDAFQDAALLAQIDLLTPEGTIRASMSDKFRQLNHLLGIVDGLDVVRDLKAGSVLHVIDAGCGKAYLSLAMTHVLKKRGVHVRLLGVDTNAHVIEHNTSVARHLGFTDAEFVLGSIDSVYRAEHRTSATAATKCDVLIALHACDTATDEALALGVRSQALAMLVAPCCHHHVQKQLRTNARTLAPEVQPLLEDGIIRERVGDLITDVMRRDIIRSHGYDAHLEEFIALEHTMKNVLLKATKSSKKATVPNGLPPSVKLLMDTWKVEPYLATLL